MDITPLGAPELGMTRAEILSYQIAQEELFLYSWELFLMILFAYTVAMYVAGNKLTLPQRVLANTMYTIVMSVQIYRFHTYHVAFNEWGDYSGLGTVMVEAAINWLPLVMVLLGVALVTLSMWFVLQRTEQAKTE